MASHSEKGLVIFMTDKKDLPVHQLGKNEIPFVLTPKLKDSTLVPGMKAVVPDESGYFSNITGRNARK